MMSYRLDGIPRSMPLIHSLLLAGGLIAARAIVRIVFSDAHASHDYHSRSERIILIGANRFGTAFIQLLRAYAPQREPVVAAARSRRRNGGPRHCGRAGARRSSRTRRDRNRICDSRLDTDRVVIACEVDFLGRPVLSRARETAA